MLPAEVAQALDQVKSRLSSIGDEISQPALRGAVKHYLELPGKLVRPLLLLTFSYSLDRRSLLDPRVLEAAMLVEMLHVVSLLQDDVMDRHGERRGMETARAKYGDGYSILASDWLIAESIRHALKIGPEVVGYLAEVAKRLAEGQALDLEGDRAAAAELKTAPLMEAALVMPAMILNRRDLLEAARGLGRALGLLYQFSDDVADEGAERPLKGLAEEIKAALGRLRGMLGEAVVPLEGLVGRMLERALEGTLTSMMRLD